MKIQRAFSLEINTLAEGIRAQREKKKGPKRALLCVRRSNLSDRKVFGAELFVREHFGGRAIIDNPAGVEDDRAVGDL